MICLWLSWKTNSISYLRGLLFGLFYRFFLWARLLCFLNLVSNRNTKSWTSIYYFCIFPFDILNLWWFVRRHFICFNHIWNGKIHHTCFTMKRLLMTNSCSGRETHFITFIFLFINYCSFYIVFRLFCWCLMTFWDWIILVVREEHLLL